MSFVIFMNHVNGFLQPLREQVKKGTETVSHRGYSWPDLVIPPDQRVGLPLDLTVYGTAEDVQAYAQKSLGAAKTKGPREASDDEESEDIAGKENNFERARGMIYHESVLGILRQARDSIHDARDVRTLNIARSLERKRKSFLAKRSQILDSKQIPKSKRSVLNARSDLVANFETLLVNAQVNYWISRSPGMHLESLADSALPIMLDHDISFPEMGFPGNMKPDFVLRDLATIGDLKTGKENPAHRLKVTGYALAYEHQHRIDIDFGIVLYVDVQNYKAPLYKVDVFIISDTYRKVFVEQRKTKFDILRQELQSLRQP